jgi:hypothetical protein
MKMWNENAKTLQHHHRFRCYNRPIKSARGSIFPNSIYEDVQWISSHNTLICSLGLKENDDITINPFHAALKKSSANRPMFPWQCKISVVENPII